jgi:hypothetical protein
VIGLIGKSVLETALTVNGNLKGSANSIVFGTSSGGTLDLNGSNNTYNSKVNIRGDNHQRITC